MSNDGLRLHPFRGLRYAPDQVGDLAAVTSPPYDVVVRPDGLDHLERAHPYNIVRLILPHSRHAAHRHRQAAETLRRWRATGVLVTDPEPALYVYEQRHGHELQRGLIGALRLTPPEDGIVLPHEDVMADVVRDRADLMRETAANLEPLLLSYRGDGTVSGAAAAIEHATSHTPLLTTTTEDGHRHRLWRLTDPALIRQATDDLARHRALIADGHHRWATYLRLRDEHDAPHPNPWDFGLVLLVDTARYPLRVQPIHRVLRRLPPATAMSRLGGTFRCRTVPGPLSRALRALAAARGNAFLLTGDGTFRLLDQPDEALLRRTVPNDRPPAWRGLDATVLHLTLLRQVWGVTDTPEDVAYLHDAEAATAQAARLGGSAVLLRPVGEDTVRALAEQGVTMPRKTTSFGPKPATGLVLRSLTPR